MKKIVLSLMLLLPLSMVAQEIKIAVVNTDNIFNDMPENSAIESQLMEIMERYQSELQSMNAEYTRKVSELNEQQESLPDNIKATRIGDIEDLQGRMEILYQAGEQEISKKREELYAPVIDKLQKAIDEVGEENGYTIMFNPHPQILLYTSKTVIDATDKVKAKLGIR